METQVRIRDQLHGGCSDIDTTYWDDDYAQSEVKEQERHRVLNFILDRVNYFPHDYRRVRLLSFPGIHWRFESIFRKRVSGTPVGLQVIGLEKSATLYAKSRLLMPGRKHAERYPSERLVANSFEYGREVIDFSQVRSDVNSSSVEDQFNKLVLLSAETYATMLSTDYGAEYEQKLAFGRHFGHRNAVWLDYTSPVTPSIENTLRWLALCMEAPAHRRGYGKPVVVTVLNARDYCHSPEERIERMTLAQPGLQYRSHWTYVGKGGVSMLTACFTLL